MEEHSITNTTKVLMLCTAGLFDLLKFLVNFIPILGQALAILVNAFGKLTLSLWLWMNGVSFNSTKRIATAAGGFLIGSIPVVDALPNLTLEILIIFSTIIIEKKVVSKIPGGKMIENAGMKKIPGK